MEKPTAAELKKINRTNVFKMIYERQKTCKQDIAFQLGLSLPTVTQNLKELESLSLIEKNGFFESSGGRKPQAICCVRKSRVAIGVEVTTRHLHMVAVDLYGDVLRRERLQLTYSNSREYYREMGGILNNFADALHVSAKKILGVGIGIQGLASPDGQYVTYGEILGCTGARLSDFAEFVKYPCRLMHDSEAAAFAELWFSKSMGDKIYISLSRRLGGAVIMDSKIYSGGSIGSGHFEHMIIKPGGRPCYCGKHGCLDTYCSVEALCQHEKELDEFFEQLRSGDPQRKKEWAEYLEILSGAIDNVHRVIDCDVILGGHLAPYLNEEDLRTLNDLAREKSFVKSPRDYIAAGVCDEAVVPIGCALIYMQEFLDSI